MKFVKINKGLLFVTFFMPFVISACSRSEMLKESPDFFDYLLYPTENSVSGFGLAYSDLTGLLDGKSDFKILLSISLAFIFSILGFVLSFFHQRKLLFYLSILSTVSFFVFIITVLFVEPEGLQALLWGFWLATILSIIDCYLIWKYTYS